MKSYNGINLFEKSGHMMTKVKNSKDHRCLREQDSNYHQIEKPENETISEAILGRASHRPRNFAWQA
jgi:hypothetical protein